MRNLQRLSPARCSRRWATSSKPSRSGPKSATEFELYWTCFGYADDDDELRRLRFEQANLVGPAGYNNMEDGEVGILAQRGIRRRRDHSVIEMGGRGPIAYHDGHQRVSETMVRGFWRHYCRLMDVQPAA